MSKTILLTGVSGKFGRVFLDHLLSKGHTVIGISSSQKSLDNIIKMHDLGNKKFFGIVVDLCEINSAQKIIKILRKKNLYPHCLINNARSLNFLNTIEGFTPRENFINEYLLDVIVPYELSMELKSFSSDLNLILNIGSQYGTVAANPSLYSNPEKDSPIHYGVAKAALSHLTKELAIRLASDGIQVNCIAYGGVEGRVNTEFKERYSKMVPMGRMLAEEEITWPLDSLLSKTSGPMTGQTLNFDGGWSIW